jgi:hypothetical protein
MAKSRPGTDTGHLDFPSATEAHHNEKGMYVMNENEGGSVERGMVVDPESGLYVPAPPDFKHYRRVFMEHQSVEVEETFEQIETAIHDARALDAPEWFSFTDPTFGLTTRVHREALATASVIVEDFKDLDVIKEQQAEYAKSKSMAALNKARTNHNQEDTRRLLRKLQN